MKIEILDKYNLQDFLPSISEIHGKAYSGDHFTASFGFNKLMEYNKALLLASDVSVIAHDGKDVLGFIIAGYNIPLGVQKFTSANRFWIISKLIKRPKVLGLKILGLILARLKRTTPSQATFRLLSIATLPGKQSMGVGASMLIFFEKELMNRNIGIYGLSVKNSNKRAIEFYEKNGFELEKVFLDSSYYIKKVKSVS